MEKMLWIVYIPDNEDGGFFYPHLVCGDEADVQEAILHLTEEDVYVDFLSEINCGIPAEESLQFCNILADNYMNRYEYQSIDNTIGCAVM